MKIAVYILIGLAAFSVIGSTRSEATVIDAKTFKQETKKGPVFVKFFTKWCSACKSLKPTWDKLADHVLERKYNVTVVKVDAEKHSTLAEDYEVEEYPTLVLVEGGRRHVFKYDGQATVDRFDSFLQKKYLNPVPTVTSVETVSNNGGAVFFGSKDSAEYKAFFKTVMSADDSLEYVRIEDPEIIRREHGEETNKIVYYTKDLAKRAVYAGKNNQDAIMAFFNSNR